MASYYISPTGNDTTGDGSIGNPWKSLAKADSFLTQPGDILYCRGGTYAAEDDGLQSYASGTAGNPITVRNYPGETPTFRVITWTGGGNYGEILSVWGHSYWIIDGLNFEPNNDVVGFQGSWPFLIGGGSTNITVRNCRFIGHLRSSGVFTWTYAIWFLGYGGGNWIDFYDNVVSGSGNTNDPIGSAGACLGVSVNGGNVRIHGNTFSKGNHDCMSFGANTTTEVYDNTYTDSWGYSISTGGNGRKVIERNNCQGSGRGAYAYEKGSYIDNGKYAIVRYNSMWDANYGADFFGNEEAVRFYNNVIYDHDVMGVLFLSPATLGNLRFFNNVIAHNMQTYPWYVGGAKSGEITNNNNPAQWLDAWDIQFHNNWIVCFVAGAWQDDYQYAVYEQLYLRRKVSWMDANMATWANNIPNYSDPLFADPDNGDFTIAAGSSLIDQGRDLTTIASATGSGTQITVGDAGFFWVSSWSDSGGDQIIIDGDPNKVREIIAINYNTHTLTLDSSVSWTQGDSVNVYKTFSDASTVRYSGTAPDIGVYELIQAGPSPPPTPGLRVRLRRA